MAPRKAKDRFFVKRLGGRTGKDKPGDWFGVYMRSVLDQGGDSGQSHLFTAIGNSREEAERLCNMLKMAYAAFHQGLNLVATGVPFPTEESNAGPQA